MDEIYISTDIEADGPIPGPYSMLSLGSAAFSINKESGVELLSTFSRNLETLEGATTDPTIMAWWDNFPEAWAINRKNPQPPGIVMSQYIDWIKLVSDKPVFLAWPATNDFMFVYWYLMKLIGKSPFEYSALDAKSYAMAVKKTSWHDTSSKMIHDDDRPINPQPHVAVYDAIHQGWRDCMIIHQNMFGD